METSLNQPSSQVSKAGHTSTGNPALMASSPQSLPPGEQNGSRQWLSGLQWISSSEGLQFPNPNPNLLSQSE